MLDALPEFRLFKDLPAKTADVLKDRLELIELPHDSYLWEEGEDADDVYFIISGGICGKHIGTEGQEAISLLWEAGTLCGHTACLTGMPRSENMMAYGDTVVARLDKDTFLELFTTEPVFIRYILRHMAFDIRDLILVTSARAMLSAKGLVANDIIRRHTLEQATEITVPVQKTWAATLGLTRETLSRALSALAKDGLVKVSGNHVELLDMDGLIAEGTP